MRDFDDFVQEIKDEADLLRDACLEFENKIYKLEQDIVDSNSEIEDLNQMIEEIKRGNCCNDLRH